MGVLEVKKLIGEGFMTPTRVLHVLGTCFCPKTLKSDKIHQRYAIFLKIGFFWDTLYISMSRFYNSSIKVLSLSIIDSIDADDRVYTQLKVKKSVK